MYSWLWVDMLPFVLGRYRPLDEIELIGHILMWFWHLIRNFLAFVCAQRSQQGASPFGPCLLVCIVSIAKSQEPPGIQTRLGEYEMSGLSFTVCVVVSPPSTFQPKFPQNFPQTAAVKQPPLKIQITLKNSSGPGSIEILITVFFLSFACWQIG